MMSKNKKHAPTATPKQAAGGVSRRARMIGVTGSGALAWSLLGSSEPADAQTIRVWKSATCGCCGVWVPYMRSKGYRVVVNNINDPASISYRLGVPSALRACHTSKIGDYVIEGHVPAAAVAKLLEQRPKLKGIALPGMPPGSPGMDGPPGVYRVVGFTADGSTRRFMNARG